MLHTLKVRSFLRTSGGKGLHVLVPVHPPASWAVGHAFARAVAGRMAREQPQRYLAAAAKAGRTGRIFIDYLRNARGSTAVCSYFLRNRPHAPVATPLTWEELPGLGRGSIPPRQYTAPPGAAAGGSVGRRALRATVPACLRDG